LRPNGDAVGDRGTQQLIDRCGLEIVAGQIAVLRVSLQQPSALQKTTDALSNSVGQFGELGTARRPHPAESRRSVGALDIHPVEEQHMEVNIQIQRTAKTLDQRDRAGVRRLMRQSGLLDQVRSNHPVNDAEHLAHDRRAAGEQETQWKRKTQHPLAHRLFRENLIHQQRGTFCHTACPTAGTETAPFARKRNQMLSVTGITAQP